MADSIALVVSLNKTQKRLEQMVSRTQLVRGWLNRVAYPMIIEAQRMRWASENATEGSGWRALNPHYAVMKLKKFASFPGGGRKMLIATGRLVNSVTGDNTQEHYKLVEEKRIAVGTRVPYAKYVNEDRDFSKLGPKTLADIREKLRAYIVGGSR